MNINADFSKRAVLDTTNMDWVPSPMSGVERKMLDRMGVESGHATSIVCYAPNSSFPSHTHPGGEEFLVLAGTFSDEQGDFPRGSYVRNPRGSTHAPSSREGCVIFVKLCQFAETDTDQIVVYTESVNWEPTGDGIESQFLHQHGCEKVQLLRLQPAVEYHIVSEIRGSELLVLEGNIEESGGKFGKGGWIRNPAGYATTITALSETVLYLKTGHLKA